MNSTDETLLDRLKDMDAHDAWQVFYDLYWQPVIRYARKLGLVDSEAHDVLQDTMVALMHLLPRFAYDANRGKFRNFLLTIVHRKALEVMRRRRRNARLMEGLGLVAADDDIPSEIERMRWHESVFETVLAELQAAPDGMERSVAIFRDVALRRRSPREVALEFGTNENNVYQTKDRIMRRLRAGVRRRLADGGEEPDY